MIRNLQEKDISTCLDIYNWYIENTVITFEMEPLTLQSFTDRVHTITQRYPWLVLEEEGKIVGYAYLDVFNARSAYDYTCDVSIYLDHTIQGKGYGSKLMQALLDVAKEDGYHNAISIVTEGNQRSEKIHEKFGFEKVGFLPHTGYKFHTWLGVTYYQKTIQEGEPSKLKNKDYTCE